MLMKLLDFLPGAKTWTGAAIASVGSIAMLVGWDWFGAVSNDITGFTNQLITTVGAGLALYGKIMAAIRGKKTI